MSSLLHTGALALSLAISATAASAHVTAEPAEAQPGSYFRTAFRVPHGCNGQPTTAIRIAIPDGIASAKAQAKPGWEVKSETRKLAKPIDAGHGRKTDTVVSAVSWSGGSLPNDLFDEFGLVLKLPDTPGTQLWFPVVQSCAGGEMRWDQIPAAGQSAHYLERPAVLIRIADNGGHQHHGHGAAPAQSGDIAVAAPFARATPAKVGGAFMTLRNAGRADDRLIKAVSPIAESAELHTHIKDGEAMRMRPVQDIPVPAGGETKLEPGSYHIMLIGLKQPLKEGMQFPLTLTFEKAGTVTLQVPVQKAGAGGGDAHGGHGGHHKH